MDPFEARLQFTKILQTLTSSVGSNENSIQFLLQQQRIYKDLSEDLYSCILEELDRNSSLSTRLNILYFIESLCIQGIRNSELSRYVAWVNRDLKTIIDKVVPDGQLGLINFNYSMQILNNIRQNQLLKDEYVKNALQLLHDKMVAVQLNGSTTTSTSTSTNTSTDSKIKPMTKEEILKRMDDDRERSKRPKENIWAVDYEGSLYNEFGALWDIAEMTDLDYEQMKEDSEIAKASVTA